MGQLSYSTHFAGFESNKAAKEARDADYRKLRKLGVRCKRWVLKDQWKKYDHFGGPVTDKYCDVYMLNIYDRLSWEQDKEFDPHPLVERQWAIQQR